jgi:hypothetical protein
VSLCVSLSLQAKEGRREEEEEERERRARTTKGEYYII